uniref:Uncharacterized protein n=1 Tax=Rhizophora mucronata TaxID=61149 RepID=A0A2P2N9F6_RHIMU
MEKENCWINPLWKSSYCIKTCIFKKVTPMVQVTGTLKLSAAIEW